MNGGLGGPGGGFDLDAWTATDRSILTTVHQQHGATPALLPPPAAGHVPLGRPSLPATPAGPMPLLIQRDGDWGCSSCGNINFAKRTRCNKCGALKPKKGKINNFSCLDCEKALNTENGHLVEDAPSFGGPAGLFKRGDWPCTHCGNVNWARRDKCNVCNAPKPSSTEAPRTGRGGGHFDLQDPRDRQQHLSDEEDYDEFGRKKKKKKSSSTGNPVPSAQDTIVSGRSTNPVGSGNAAPYSGDVATTYHAQGSTSLKLYFPPPPLCYLKGRTASMSSVSSFTSDYTEPDSPEPRGKSQLQDDDHDTSAS